MRTKQEILESYYNKGRIYDHQEEMEFMLHALGDFEVFFKHIVGHSVGDYHHEIFGLLKNERACMMAARGHAKTEICSVCFSLWRGMNREGMEIVIISSAEPQSLRIIRRIKALIDDNEILKELKPRAASVYWSKSEITLSNKTRITASPFTDTIRGNRIDLCICDDILKKELSEQSPAITKFFEIVEPAVDTEGSQLIVVGTPQSEYDLLHRLMEEGSGYKFGKFPCIERINGKKLEGKLTFPERWTKTKLQERYRNMGMAAFMQEYMCVPIQAGDIIFDYDTLIKPNINTQLGNLNEAVVGCEYWLGIDIALSTEKAADFSAYVIIEKRSADSMYRVVRVERPSKGTYTDKQFDRIKQLNDIFKFRRILIENRGNSMTLVQLLQHHSSTAPVTKDFPTTHAEKERIVLHLQKMLANREIELPPSSILINELKTIGVKHAIRMGQSTERIESLTGHDDTVMGLCLALEAATSQYGRISLKWN